jgi:hypothetical protein
MRKLWIVLLCVCVLGCEPVANQTGSPIAAQEFDYVLAVVVDMSGSFSGEMQSGSGRAHRFLMRAVDLFFRNRIGEGNDRIIITQVSGTQRALLWDGTPRGLRQEFSSARAFEAFLLQNSNPAGSRIHDGVRETIEYVMGMPGVSSGKTRTFVMVLSDMDENFSEPAASREKLVNSLKAYAQAGGVAGIYWCNQQFVPGWRKDLKDCGFKSFVVESDIVADPAIPVFDN